MESENIPPSLELIPWQQPQRLISQNPPDNRYELIVGNLRDNVIANLLGIAPSKNPISMELRTHVETQLRQLFPSFHTPDHPTYASMIRRAIEEINEESGASEEEISAFLKREYRDLPFAHESFLSHHLKKLCDNNDIVHAHNGRYMFPEKVGNCQKVVKRFRKRRRQGWRRSKHCTNQYTDLSKKQCGMIAEERSKESGQLKMSEEIERVVLQGRESIHGQEIEFVEDLDKLDGQSSNKFKEQNVVDKQLISTTEQHKEEFMTSNMKNRSEEFLSKFSSCLLLMEKPHCDYIEPLCGLRTDECLEEEQWKQRNSPDEEKGIEQGKQPLYEVIEQGKQPQYEVKEQSGTEERLAIVGSKTSVTCNGEGESLRQGEQQKVHSPNGKLIIVCGLLSEKQYQANVSGKKKTTKLLQYETSTVLGQHAEFGHHGISSIQRGISIIQQSPKRKAEINTNMVIPFPSNQCHPTKLQGCKLPRRGRSRKLKPDVEAENFLPTYYHLYHNEKQHQPEAQETGGCLKSTSVANPMINSSLHLDSDQPNYNEQQQKQQQQKRQKRRGRPPRAVKAAAVTLDASLHIQQQ
ncbi:hypothetical protein K2173_002187 [Erythroxylum novogranatense]|uniref:H15 domain-containing protein n=1 Tax=Erythroxylum novogranatense TaxID=1862640 RepID=A0AAV8TTJ8_9ROSI|nr:hypothetical protein K2173_002187 [Erythroxylum novogranatense]